MHIFFDEKMRAVSKAFFILNGLGFYPGGVNAFIQAKNYKCMCFSLLLYGLEIFSLNKTNIEHLELSQNDLIRYMTGLS
jgi:hypothetical protein